MTHSKHIQWLLDNRAILKPFIIANQVGMPPRTLAAFMEGIRPLPEKWREPLENYLKKLLTSIEPHCLLYEQR